MSLTKLIIFIIVLNLLGTFLKKFQERQRKKQREEMMMAGTPPPEEPKPAPMADEPGLITEPEDLLRDIFAKLEEPAREPETPAAPETPVYKHEAPIYRGAPQAAEYRPAEFQGREYDAKPYTPKPFDPQEFEKREFEAIRSGLDYGEQVEARQTEPLPFIQREEPDRRPAAVPSADAAESAEAVAYRTKLRQGVIMAEILGTPKGLQNA